VENIFKEGRYTIRRNEPLRRELGKSGDHRIYWGSWLTRGATVWARGKITHPDHKTVKLFGWHLVSTNREWSSRGLAFLD
jgi:hypothetical protein